MNDFFRLKEWWNVKVSLFFGMLTVFSIYYSLSFKEYAYLILESFLVLFPIAAWANVVNDYGDVESDRLAGKLNRLDNWSKSKQIILVYGSVPLLFLVPFLYGYPLELYLFLVLTVLAFYCYSVSPFRFKSKGWYGVFMDALATQVFPILFIMQRIQGSDQFNVWFYIPLFLWLLAAGLRLHLVHQFMDVKNDKKAGLDTVFTLYNRKNVDQLVKRFILPVELLFLLFSVFMLRQYWLCFVLVIYAFVQFQIRKKYGIKHTLYAIEKDERVLLSEYYNYYILFITLGVASVWLSHFYALPLVLFLVLFFYSYWPNVNEMIHLIKTYRFKKSE